MKLLTFPTWNWTWAYEKTGYDNTNLFLFEFQNILHFLYIIIVNEFWIKQMAAARINIVTTIPIRKVGKNQNVEPNLTSINNVIFSLFQNNLLLLNFTTLFENLIIMLWLHTYLFELNIEHPVTVLCFYLQKGLTQRRQTTYMMWFPDTVFSLLQRG